MGTFFVSFEVELICVLFRAAIDVALEGFLKFQILVSFLNILLGCGKKYLSCVTEDMSIQTVLSSKALIAESAFELEFRSVVFGRTVFAWFFDIHELVFTQR